MNRTRPVSLPVFFQACGTLRGKNAQVPGPPTVTSSPILNRIVYAESPEAAREDAAHIAHRGHGSAALRPRGQLDGSHSVNSTAGRRNPSPRERAAPPHPAPPRAVQGVCNTPTERGHARARAAHGRVESYSCPSSIAAVPGFILWGTVTRTDPLQLSPRPSAAVKLIR